MGNSVTGELESSESGNNDWFEQKATFTINGKMYNFDQNLPLNTTLNTFIRKVANLTGTKFMCLEGGCGACIVHVSATHPATGQQESYAVNSCLVPVASCHGWDITTIEGIGSKKDGYHKIQTRLTQFNGSQCGYCSSGMVMNMYSLMENNKKLTMNEVENSFGGNICRCTGYRPILDAFKSFCVDAPIKLQKKCEDIEELHKIKMCANNGLLCAEDCKTNWTVLNGGETKMVMSPLIHLQSNGSEWYTVSTVQEILTIFKKIGNSSYMLVAGNTAQGVYRRVVEPQYYININGVKELKTHTTAKNVTLGANMSLTETMALFNTLAEEKPIQYAYTKELAKHIDLVANVGVRNIGTLAGNLSIKHQHKEFPSDICLILETVRVTLNIVDKSGTQTNVNILTYLGMDMTHKLIKSIQLPPLDNTYTVCSYKIMPRAQNAHAYVNAGFLFRFDENDTGKVLEKPNILFGGINPGFIHAGKTELLVQGKNVLNKDVLQRVLKTLDEELNPDHILPDAAPAYRKGLACSLFYKFILNKFSNKVQKSVKSGGLLLSRPVSSGKQKFDTNKAVWPLNQPIVKTESLAQCSGEAEYINDTPTIVGELYAAFVLTTVGQGNIKSINTKDALTLKGVVKFIGHENIPGKNSFTPPAVFLGNNEEILCSGKVMYAGQPLGIIVAETRQLALKAAQLVTVEYTNVKKPLIHISDVLKSGDHSRLVTQKTIQPTDTKAKSETKHVIKGSFEIGGQYHFTMETQVCVCIPIEDGMDIYSSTQWMNLTQLSAALALGVPVNRINVKVRRLGGAYGSRLSRCGLVSTACAIAANATNKPVRFILTLEDNMKAIGKRFPCLCNYEVGVNDEGIIKYMDTTVYENTGCSFNDTTVAESITKFMNCYDSSTWKVTGITVRTDVSSNTYCRAPGTTEGIVFIENIMEHIAKEVKLDPIQVRISNMSKEDNPLPQLIQDVKNSSDYDNRVLMIAKFNKENRWKKRGISLLPMRYPLDFVGDFHSLVSIYVGDGSVAVSHGGLECGQGINTKVQQVCAYTLGIPLELVSIKPSNTLTAPNDMATASSFTSETCCYATMMCCKEILKRLEPVKKKLKYPSWQLLIIEAYKDHVDLCASYMFTLNDDVKNYTIWGIAASEVEIDVLTGQHQILRVDILEDTGESLSPLIDIGQVEGAYMMGLGFWLLEHLVTDPNNGELLTNRTWNYKVPGAKDIPIDFRVKFRRNSPNPTGVLRSKATGEPPLCLSCGLLFAVRNAITSARANTGSTESWYQMNAPATTEAIFLSGLTTYKQFIP